MRRALAMLVISTILLALLPLAFLTPPATQAEKSPALQPITCPRRGGTLVIIHWGDPKSFNPDSQVDDALYNIAMQIYNRLVALDIDYNVVPDLAESWEVAPNASVFIFHLRKNVKWHDGYPFTCRDVKYTFEAIKKYRGIAYGLLKMSKLKSIECLDNYTVVFRYSEPFPAFLGFLAWYGTFVLPEHIFNKSEYKDWMDPKIPALHHPIGTGPFKFVEYVKGSHIVLEANPDYFKGRPCIDKIIYKIVPDATAALQTFLAGEGDILNNRPPLSEIPRLNKTPGVIVEMRPMPSRWYIGFNLLRPLFQKKEFRYAIAYAINRKEIVDKAMNGYGYPAEGTYVPAIKWAYNPNVKLPEYNPEKAKELLDKLGLIDRNGDGFRDYPNGTRIVLRLLIFTGAEEEAIARVIKEDLKKVGLDVKIEEYEIATWEAKVVKQRDFDMALCDGFEGPDPDNMRIRFAPGAYINFANYSNMEFKRLLDLASKEPDPEKRKELYWKAQEIMAEDLPYLPLADLVAFYIYRTEWHGLPWHLPGVVGLGVYERVWWEKGTPVTTTPKPVTTTTAKPAAPTTTATKPSPTTTPTPRTTKVVKTTATVTATVTKVATTPVSPGAATVTLVKTVTVAKPTTVYATSVVTKTVIATTTVTAGMSPAMGIAIAIVVIIVIGIAVALARRR